MNDHCPTCGARTMGRWEPLNAALVSCLVQAIQCVHTKGVNRFHLQRELDLTKTAYNNFQKLRYHGLIAHADQDNPKTGEWLITKRGGMFLRGEMSVPRKVLVFRNQVKDHSSDLVHINELKGKIIAFERAEAYEYVEVPVMPPAFEPAEAPKETNTPML